MNNQTTQAEANAIIAEIQASKAVPRTLIEKVFAVSDRINHPRTLTDVCNYGLDEVRECAQEVAIVDGVSHRRPDKDGAAGEALDVIICMLDLIRLAAPDLSEEDIIAMADEKLAKWERKYSVD